VALDDSERRQILDTVERFARERVGPQAAEIDERDEFPRDLYRAMGELGLFSLFVPESHGGVGPELVTPLLVAERLARASLTTALVFSNCGDATGPIVHAAAEHLKREYLPGIARGEIIPCFALSEPGAGSDAAAITTRARREGDSYVLDGRKAWCTNGAVGDVFVVFAKTDPEAGSRGVSAFLVPADTPGFERGRSERLIGLRGSPTTELTLTGARIPAENRLGAEGEGFRIAMITLDEARLNCAAMALGGARGALACALDYARERVQFAKPVIEHQGLAFLLAERVTELAAAESLWRRAIELLAGERSRRASTFAAMAKLCATDTAMRATVDAVQAMGAVGLSRVHPVERMMRDVKALQIFDGTNQIQKLLIGRHLAREGLPFDDTGDRP